MGESDDFVRNRRSPGRVAHPSGVRKQLVVDFLEGKQSRQLAQVRPAHHGEKECNGCEHFKFPGQTDSPCSKVVGNVNPTDTCDSHTQRGQGSFSENSETSTASGETNANN